MNVTRPLRTALLANAVFSATCALLMLARPQLVESLLDIQAAFIVRLLGFGLSIFAIDLVHQATRPRLATWRALYASVGDFLWVIGSAIGVLLFPGVLSGTGVAVVLAVAGVVLVFGIWQIWGIDRSHRTENRALYRHCLVVRTEAPAATIWNAIERMGDIQNYAPSLVKSEVLDGTPPGVGAVRCCTDRAGRSWTEECVDFEPGHSLTMRFVCEAPNFPFPASTMMGGWKVMSAGMEAADVMVWWEMTPKPRFLAPILLPVLGFGADRDFTEVIRRMADKGMARKQTRAWLLPRFC